MMSDLDMPEKEKAQKEKEKAQNMMSDLDMPEKKKAQNMMPYLEYVKILSRPEKEKAPSRPLSPIRPFEVLGSPYLHKKKDNRLWIRPTLMVEEKPLKKSKLSSSELLEKAFEQAFEQWETPPLFVVVPANHSSSESLEKLEKAVQDAGGVLWKSPPFVGPLERSDSQFSGFESALLPEFHSPSLCLPRIEVRHCAAIAKAIFKAPGSIVNVEEYESACSILPEFLRNGSPPGIGPGICVLGSFAALGRWENDVLFGSFAEVAGLEALSFPEFEEYVEGNALMGKQLIANERKAFGLCRSVGMVPEEVILDTLPIVYAAATEIGMPCSNATIADATMKVVGKKLGMRIVLQAAVLGDYPDRELTQKLVVGTFKILE